jgi:hypothetical protein
MCEFMFKRVQQSLDRSINIDNTVCGQILSTSILHPVIIPTTIFLSTDWRILSESCGMSLLFAIYVVTRL